MKKNLLLLLLLGCFSVNIFAQNNGKSKFVVNFANFKSDGCSMFPDGDYRNCCVAHDVAYFAGGSWTTRWQADKNLYKCVAATKGFQHKIIAPVMWLGVRIGGVHFLPTPFRWGFGRKKIKANALSPVVSKTQNQSTQ